MSKKCPPQVTMQKAVTNPTELSQWLQSLIRAGYKIQTNTLMYMGMVFDKPTYMAVTVVSSRCKANNISDHIIDS